MRAEAEAAAAKELGPWGLHSEQLRAGTCPRAIAEAAVNTLVMVIMGLSQESTAKARMAGGRV